MLRSYIIISILFFTIILGSSCAEDRLKFTDGTIKEIFQKAKQQNKNVFIFLSQPDCKRCKTNLKIIEGDQATVDSLNKNYICHMINANSFFDNDSYQILNCLAFPMPYIFDNNGNLISFGYKKTKKSKYYNPSSIGFTNKQFNEIFHLNMSTDKYKEMISSTLKVYLKLDTSNISQPELLDLLSDLNKSINHNTYCYNLYLANKIHRKLDVDCGINNKIRSKFIEIFTPRDKILYSSVAYELQIPLDSLYKQSCITQRNNSKLEVDIIKLDNIKIKKKYPIKIKIRNNENIPFMIHDITYSCSCIDLNWTKKPLLPKDSMFISGYFKANFKGAFNRKIYIHNNSKNLPLEILTIKGNVE